MTDSTHSKSRAPVLIANRGEIAIRIARTCRALGFPTVAIYSDADRFAEHVRYCDAAYAVGAAPPQQSYLHVERVLEAARQSGAGYIHPGYGFLSERGAFAEACAREGITFVGPTAESMDLMGDKIHARATVDRLGVPRVPGSAGAVPSAEEALRIASQIGYPILLKAAAGGGGKGMRRVDAEAELRSAFDAASREALSAFGDGALYVEKFIEHPHHVEIQVFGDGKGGGVHLGERECSVQRRHQKVLEESPSPILNQFPKTRQQMTEAALQITRHIRYAGAGTFEFIVDGKGNFYFLEMNTRLQVEHPVTEWVTGVDLVAWQLLLAAGELTLPERSPECRGAAIEVRLYAEDSHTFLPAPGALGLIQLPSGPFVRSDTAFVEPAEVSLHYDPMIAKVSVWAPTRAEALARLRVALDETRVNPPKREDLSVIGSLKTNLSFLKRLVRNSDVCSGNTTTDLISKHPELTEPASSEPSLQAALALTLYAQLNQSCGPNWTSDESAQGNLSASGSGARGSLAWAQAGRAEGIKGVGGRWGV